MQRIGILWRVLPDISYILSWKGLPALLRLRPLPPRGSRSGFHFLCALWSSLRPCLSHTGSPGSGWYPRHRQFLREGWASRPYVPWLPRWKHVHGRTRWCECSRWRLWRYPQRSGIRKSCPFPRGRYRWSSGDRSHWVLPGLRGSQFSGFRFRPGPQVHPASIYSRCASWAPPCQVRSRPAHASAWTAVWRYLASFRLLWGHLKNLTVSSSGSLRTSDLYSRLQIR